MFFTLYLPTRCPLRLTCASAQAHLNSVTFKLGATVWSPVKPYSTTVDEITHIFPNASLTLSICIPTIPTSLRALISRDHIYSSSYLLVLYP